MRLFLFTALFAVCPSVTLAAININEVAWMGGADSANDEWIELYNSGGESVVVDGWIISDGMNLEIELAGTIGAGQYAVLERTNDSSAPGSAFMIYTGALTNTGATLTLRQDNGALVDQVAGGENWEQIGGDNTTKETAQYTSGGWVTAEATPGKQNVVASEIDPEPSEPTDIGEETQRTKTKTVNSSAKPTRTLKVPDTTLKVSINVPETIYVNQPVVLQAVPSGLGEVIMDSLQYTWNFGDLATSSGVSPQHTYHYAGEYVVTLRAAYARHDYVFQKTINVLPVRFSLALDEKSNILIHNNARYQVDLSNYRLSANKIVTFPAMSFISAGGTIAVPLKKVGGLRFAQAVLIDRYDNVVAELVDVPTQDEEVVVAIAAPTLVTQSTPLISPSSVPTIKNFTFATSTNPTLRQPVSATASTTTSTGNQIDDTNTLSAATVLSQPSNPHVSTENWPMFGLVGLIFLGIASLAMGQKHSYAKVSDDRHV